MVTKPSVRVYAPASIANVGPGFDIMGMAIDAPGDVLELELTAGPVHRIINESGISLPEDPSLNVSTVAIDALLDHLGRPERFQIRFLKKIPAGSGIGSSAASSAGAVFGANLLLGSRLSRSGLMPFAMKGEQVASGSPHADNIAPVLMGGFTLVTSYNPLRVINIEGPGNLWATVVHPGISIATLDSRRILKEKIPMKTAISQSGNLAGLVIGLMRSDYGLISASLHDSIAEPERAFLIPGYYEVKQAAMEAGALGAGISGSGPSIFALSLEKDAAGKIGAKMQEVFGKKKIRSTVFVSRVNKKGVTRVEG